MVAVTVGALAKHDVRARRHFGVFQNRRIVAADVAGKHHDRLVRAFGDRQFEARRAENVSRVVLFHGEFGAELERPGARIVLELVEHVARVLFGVKGQWGFVTRIAMLCGVPGVVLLYVP